MTLVQDDEFAQPRASSEALPTVEADRAGGDPVLRLAGVWLTATVGSVDADLSKAVKATGDAGTLKIDASAVSHLDTAGAWLIVRTMRIAQARNQPVRLAGLKQGAQTLVDEVAESTARPEPPPPSERVGLATILATIGHYVWDLRRDATMGLHMLGAAVRGGLVRAAEAAAYEERFQDAQRAAEEDLAAQRFAEQRARLAAEQARLAAEQKALDEQWALHQRQLHSHWL